MASPTKQLMDVFNDEARLAAKDGNYHRKFSFDSAENAVNNIMHGRPPLEVFAEVEKTLTWRQERATADGDAIEAEAFRDAVILLQTLREDLLRKAAER